MNLFTTLTAVIAANAAVLIVAPSDAFSHELPYQHEHGEGVVPKARQLAQAETEKPNAPDLPNPMVLEYKIKTHVEALARKYGYLNRIVKECNVHGSYFEESALSDALGENLSTAMIDAAKQSYREGMERPLPPCISATSEMNSIMPSLNRHKEIIGGTSSLLELVRDDLKRHHEGGSARTEGSE